MDGKLDSKRVGSRFPGDVHDRRGWQSAPLSRLVAEGEEGAGRRWADSAADPVSGDGQCRGAARFVEVCRGDVDECRIGAKGLVNIDLGASEQVIDAVDRLPSQLAIH